MHIRDNQSSIRKKNFKIPEFRDRLYIFFLEVMRISDIKILLSILSLSVLLLIAIRERKDDNVNFVLGINLDSYQQFYSHRNEDHE